MILYLGKGTCRGMLGKLNALGKNMVHFLFKIVHEIIPSDILDGAMSIVPNHLKK